VQQNFSEFANLNFIIFRIETIDGTANAMEDYLPINEIVTFAPKEREKKVRDYN
jgi:Calx-beta domain